MDNNWTVVSNYISTIRISSKVRDLFVFRYFTSMSTAVHLRQRSAKYCVFAGMFDSNDSTVLYVFPDGTYQDFPTHRLRENIVFVTITMVPIIATVFGLAMLSIPGKLYPPKKNKDITADEINIFTYSANK